MPSQTLLNLSTEIEEKGPDHLAQFFMYASLLNVVTASNEVAYEDTLPQTSKTMLRSVGESCTRFLPAGSRVDESLRLYVGDLSEEFHTNLRAYARSFKNPSPSIGKIMGVVAATCFRTSQVADLSYIICKMRDHLNALNTAPENATNRKIYGDLAISTNREMMLGFLRPIAAISQQSLNCMDYSVSALLLFVTALVSLTVLLLLTSALASMIATGVLVAATCATAAYVGCAIHAAGEIERLAHELHAIEFNMVDDRATTQQVLEPAYIPQTMFHTLFKPMRYTGVTIMEQFNPNDTCKERTDEQRAEIDRLARGS